MRLIEEYVNRHNLNCLIAPYTYSSVCTTVRSKEYAYLLEISFYKYPIYYPGKYRISKVLFEGEFISNVKFKMDSPYIFDYQIGATEISCTSWSDFPLFLSDWGMMEKDSYIPVNYKEFVLELWKLFVKSYQRKLSPYATNDDLVKSLEDNVNSSYTSYKIIRDKLDYKLTTSWNDMLSRYSDNFSPLFSSWANDAKLRSLKENFHCI